MIKIKVYSGQTFKVTEVTDVVYNTIERLVIEKATENVEMQILLQETGITLPLLMETFITNAIYQEAIKLNNL